MTDLAAPPTDFNHDALTPSQDLILEVLTARYRLGETSWPFSTKHSKAIRELDALGLVQESSGPVEKTIRVYLTNKALVNLKLQPADRGVSDLEPAPGEYIPPANRAYADRISAYLKRVGAETMAHQAIARLFGTYNLYR